MEMFAKKDDKIKAEIHLQELTANLQLLDDLSKGKSTIEGEQELLIERRPGMEQAFMDAIVPDFSNSPRSRRILSQLTRRAWRSIAVLY